MDEEDVGSLQSAEDSKPASAPAAAQDEKDWVSGTGLGDVREGGGAREGGWVCLCCIVCCVMCCMMCRMYGVDAMSCGMKCQWKKWDVLILGEDRHRLTVEVDPPPPPTKTPA